MLNDSDYCNVFFFILKCRLYRLPISLNLTKLLINNDNFNVSSAPDRNSHNKGAYNEEKLYDIIVINLQIISRAMSTYVVVSIQLRVEPVTL